MTYDKVLDAFRSEIQAEHTLISHRMSWYVTSQSFLFSAFAIVGGQNNDWQSFLLFGLPLLGLTLSILAFQGISSAITVQNDLIDEEEKFMEKLDNNGNKESGNLEYLEEYGKTTTYGRRTKRNEHYRAMWPPKATPIVFMLAWILAPACGVVAKRFNEQALFGLITLLALLIFVGVILFWARRMFLKRVIQLEQQIRQLEATQKSEQK